MATRAKPQLATVADELEAMDNSTLHSAMALAFAEIDAATKKADNPFFKSKYADLPAIIGTVKPALVAHRLFFTQHCHPSPDGVIVETVLHHAGGESLSMGQLYVPANKRDPQGFGSAQTYARRYALQTAFGVPVEDDDGNAATKTVHARPVEAESITQDQEDTLRALASEVGADVKRFCSYLGVTELAELPANRFHDAIKALEAKRQKDPGK